MSNRRLVVDTTTRSAATEDAESVGRPNGSADQDDFVIVPETSTEGWCLGAVTNFEVPDGSTAGLLWDVGTEPLEEILPPDTERWGLYSISFPHPTKSVEDLVSAFRAVLPQLKAKYAELNS